MKPPPLFTPTPGSSAHAVRIPFMLVILADAVYGAGRAYTTPSKQASAKATLEALLSAARAGGYQQADILQTLLAKGEVSQRVKDMAVQACAAAGSEAIGRMFNAMRIKN